MYEHCFWVQTLRPTVRQSPTNLRRHLHEPTVCEGAGDLKLFHRPGEVFQARVGFVAVNELGIVVVAIAVGRAACVSTEYQVMHQRRSAADIHLHAPVAGPALLEDLTAGVLNLRGGRRLMAGEPGNISPHLG